MKRFFSAIALTALLSACGEFEVVEQANTEDQLSSILESNPKCQISENVTLSAVKYGDGSEYVVRVNIKDITTDIRLDKTHLSVGGYKLLGVSHNGHIRVTGSVNYLSNNGTDVSIDRIEHYKDGLVFNKLYKFCSF